MPTVSSRSSAPRRAAAVVLLCAAACGARAQEHPPIREIVFRGNETTQPVTMLREMTVRVGDPADPREVERSRQGVQDLGLFRDVDALLEPVEGGVRLVIKVKEKFYILPLPRADASSDGGYGYGAQVRWDNMWGLNHTSSLYFERRQPSEGDNDPDQRGVQTRSQLRYVAPFIFDSKYSASVGFGYFKTPHMEPLRYDEVDTYAGTELSRKLSGEGNQGWTGSVGLFWQDASTSGPPAPPAKGHATSLRIGARYRRQHFNVYSDEGVTYAFGVGSATEDVLSDYNFTSYGVSYARYIAIGDTPHQNLNLLFEASALHDGPTDFDTLAYAIGGTDTVRGVEPETAKGDAYYAASVEYLRPVFRKSIRALIVLDAANAFPEPGDASFDKVYASIGVGVRVRFQAFVALDLELGMAWPLNGGPPRLFASKV